MTVAPFKQRPAYEALARHHDLIAERHLRDLFAADPSRGERMCAEAVGLFLDYSKNRITDETVDLLVRLAEESGLVERRAAMFAGEHINVSEDRAVLHVALRMPRDETLVVDGVDVVAEVHAVLDRMASFSDRVRSGEWKGHTGKPIRNVINVGIGGSDLGPVMAYEALRRYSKREMTFRFVSNVDSTDLVEATRDLVHHLLQDLFHLGDDHQRDIRPPMGDRRPRRRGGRGQALRGRLDERGARCKVRHRHGQHVRLLGLGRRALFDGLGDRALNDAGDRP